MGPMAPMHAARAGVAILAALAVATSLGGCDRPMFNMAKMKDLKAESFALMRTHPTKRIPGWQEIPKNEWPRVISSLHPNSVTVGQWGVDISTRPFFDGGWGYHVPRNKGDLPLPPGCYSEPSPGVFWYGPC